MGRKERKVVGADAMYEVSHLAKVRGRGERGKGKKRKRKKEPLVVTDAYIEVAERLTMRKRGKKEANES